MVDKQAVHDVMETWFRVKGSYKVNDDLSVDVEGDVHLNITPPHGIIPVKFGVVTGGFDVVSCGLTSLQNAPHTVNGFFMCSHNKLTNLVHGPKVVSDIYVIGKNPLRSLEGFPDTASPTYVSMRYMPKLPVPMLRLLVCEEIDVWSEPNDKPGYQIQEILRPYAGKGKQGAIKCAVELVKAGFKEVARW